MRAGWRNRLSPVGPAVVLRPGSMSTWVAPASSPVRIRSAVAAASGTFTKEALENSRSGSMPISSPVRSSASPAPRRPRPQRMAKDTATRVLESGEAARLTPMNPFERKVVHDVVAGVAGVHSESEGEEPSRRVVILPDA